MTKRNPVCADLSFGAGTADLFGLGLGLASGCKFFAVRGNILLGVFLCSIQLWFIAGRADTAFGLITVIAAVIAYIGHVQTLPFANSFMTSHPSYSNNKRKAQGKNSCACFHLFIFYN